jgi:hypothetical protein
MENPVESENSTSSKPNLPFDERKEHYEALLTLFKYAIGSLTLVISVAGFFIGFTVYSDGKEMRAAMREQQLSLQQNINELNSKELEMQQTLLDLIKTTREDVSLTGQRAISQINVIREESSTVARTEAKKRIEQVFEENKIEDFIVQVTKERLEPEVRRVVSENITALNDAKLRKVLRDISSDDESKRELADLFFQNSDPSDWTEEQLERIVNTLAIIDGNNPHKFNASIYLALAKSPVIENYFREEFIKDPQSETSFLAMRYLTKNADVGLLTLFLELFKKTSSDLRPNFYHRLIDGSLDGRNNNLTISLLNHKEIVDMLFQELKELEERKPNSIESFKQRILSLIRVNNFSGEISTTYFFGK